MAFLLVSAGLMISACRPAYSFRNAAQLRQEIIQTEAAFEQHAAQHGLAEAFYTYADESAVLHRRDSLVSGKAAILEFYKHSNLRNISLKWTPQFVDVARSGDLAYSYGPYSFNATDSTGKVISSKGIFHTVWKRQKDGSWKYVWD